MINLNRSKDNKWIIQKNISSSELIEAFVSGLHDQNNSFNSEYLVNYLKNNDAYQGRSESGNINTMSVRLSQACFYMFGFKKDNYFYPSPMTELFYTKTADKEKVSLVNLFSMQFPNPYSKTPDNFNIYIGRFFLKLLTEEKLEKRLYIDEIVYFLPFVEKINLDLYNELIDSILEFRILSYEEKKVLFTSIPDYENVFSNCMHEMNYYFIRIFNGFGCLDIIPDSMHNDGKLLSFKHGNGKTLRNDAFAARKKISGYVQLSSNLVELSKELLNNFSPFDKPIAQSDCLSKYDWIRELYEFEPLKYISIVMSHSSNSSDVIDIVKEMVYQSKYGSRDGKSFENSLKPIFELFRENRNVEIISGAGDTDLLCVMEEQNSLYKINVDAKTSHNRTQEINPIRITKHINKNSSNYCIVVSPKFSKGVNMDIHDFKIVTIEAEALANYCLKECLNSNDGFADYKELNCLIEQNLGFDITNCVNYMIDEKYGI